MKKSYSLTFLFTLILATVFTAAFVLSCASKKTIQSNSTDTTVIANNSKQTTTKTETTSQAINDTIRYYVGQLRTNNKICDSLTAIALNDYFSNYNYAKNSGNNAWSIKYDEIKRQLVIINKQAATKNTAVHDTLIKTKFIYKNKDVMVSVPVRYVPGYIKYFSLFGAACLFAIVVYSSIKLRQKYTV